MSAMSDWVDARLALIGMERLSTTTETATTLTGVCVPMASRGVIDAQKDDTVSSWCQCEEVMVDVVEQMQTARGVSFDAAMAALIAQLRADYSITSDAEATRRAWALVGELLYPGLMP